MDRHSGHPQTGFWVVGLDVLYFVAQADLEVRTGDLSLLALDTGLGSDLLCSNLFLHPPFSAVEAQSGCLFVFWEYVDLLARSE